MARATALRKPAALPLPNAMQCRNAESPAVGSLRLRCGIVRLGNPQLRRVGTLYAAQVLSEFICGENRGNAPVPYGRAVYSGLATGGSVSFASSSPMAVSGLYHFFANGLEMDDLGGLAVVKMAGDRILDHGLKFLFRVRRRENLKPWRKSRLRVRPQLEI